MVSSDYLVNWLFKERHGPMMSLVPIRPKSVYLVTAIEAAFVGKRDYRVLVAHDIAHRV